MGRELGMGGMATVYLAHDLKHERDVAIKVLHPDLGAALGGERFLSEIRTTARLQHPHILPLLDSGDADGLLYYVMPLVNGETLRARLSREKQLPIDEAVLIAREVADALSSAHALGIIHRDIKPENILLQGGHALVADFGIALAVQSAGGARMTQTGLSLGTPQYMSPEQAMGERTIDARSDVYALGAVTYEMLTGEPPFTGATLQAIVAKVVNAEPERPSLIRKSVPSHIETAVLKSLEKLPADRHATATEFAASLKGGSAPVSASMSSPSSTPAVRRTSRVAGAALLLVVGGIAGWLARPVSRAGPLPSNIQPLRLTHSGAVGCAAISPDGQQFAALIGTFDDETSCSGTLVIRPLPTGVDQVLAADVRDVRRVRWSPAGDAVLVSGALADKAVGVWIFPTKSGVPRLLMSGETSVVGFLDARHVYVAAGGNGDFYSNNGLAPTTKIRVLDVESGVETDSVTLPSAPYGGAGDFSPSGQWFALTRAVPAPGLNLVSRSGVVSDSILDAIASVVWLGNTRVAYFRERAWGAGDLLVRTVDSAKGQFVGEPTVAWSALPAARSFTSDSSGRRLMTVLRPVTDALHLLRVPNSTSDRTIVRSLNAYLGDPRLSPDGQRVAYSRQDALGSNVYIANREESVERAISSDTLSTFWLNWLNSQQLVRSDLKGTLLSVDLATGRVRRLSPQKGESILTAAGNTWMFLADGASSPMLRDSLLGDARPLGSPPGMRPSLTFALSANGLQIAQLGATQDGRSAFAIYSTTTSTWSSPTPVAADFQRLATVTADGTVYLSRFQGTTEIWRARAGSAPTLYAKLPVHCYQGSVVVSEDGTTVACNVTTNLPDAWLVELPPASN